jgi:eukaryotic-like serine/threonine-protein kinase
MAPEIWRGEVATRRSDVYSLGVMLYEICSGDVPFGQIAPPDLPTAAQSSDPPPLLDRARGLQPAFAAVVDRCLRRNPEERFMRADEVCSALEQLVASAHADALPSGNPYRGLEAFGAEHRALFFGRALEIRTVLNRLRGDAFVLIAGDSGVGKSSLAAAGIVPRLLEGALADGRVWAAGRMVPGRRPLAALTTTLASAISVPEDEMRRMTGAGPMEIARAVRRRLRSSAGLVLYLDQLEELVTLSPLAEAAPAAEILGELCAGVPGVRIVATARSDFLTRLAALPGFGPELERALYLLRPLSAEGLRQVIVGPAQSKGVRFESEELIDSLVASAGRAEGGLPLLQFTLAELWEARADTDESVGVIRAASLDAIGGVEGALARHADGVIDRMLPAQRKAARSILLRLVTIDGTRARRTEDELLTGNRGAARAALEALVRGRLVVARQGEGGGTYEVAHEALLAGWSRLRRWLEEEAESRVILHRLETSAGEWERLGNSRDALWGSTQLAETALLVGEELPVREQTFLKASRVAVRRGRAMRRAIALALPLTALLVWGGLRIRARHEISSQIHAHLSAATQMMAEAREREGRRRTLVSDAMARFDAHDPQKAEKLWSEALNLGDDVERHFDRAGQSIERALLIDPARRDVRDAMGDLLLARALFDELRGPVDRTRIAASLAPYDASGERRQKWNAAATLTVTTQPPGAQVHLYRYDRDHSGRYAVADLGLLGATPLGSRELAIGSYLLVLEAVARAPVRYPVLVGRERHIELHVELVEPSRVPRDFVYVPPGRFLFGSSTDESTRRDFYETTPLHEAHTSAFLIARHETTFGQWIEFLLDLPAAERARRVPKVKNVGSHGLVDLEQLPGAGWQLTLQPTIQAYVARMGEPIVYPARDRRARQDWLHMPVVGISTEDAEAYAEWLSRTGRVPGARLCTEYEWERAARGADGREFPHGDRLDVDDANYDATYGKQPLAFGPDEVGSHPVSRSPIGIDDMVGNVWEWTRSSLTDNGRVLRGGSFYYRASTQHSANRHVVDPTMRDANVGLRMCATIRQN